MLSMSDLIVGTLIATFKGLSWIYDAFTFIPYFAVQRPDLKRKRSNRIKSVPEGSNPAGPWVSVDMPATGLTTSMFPGCSTIPELFSRAVETFASEPCLGTREVLAEEEERQANGKVFKKLVLGKYKWMSYREVELRVDNFGSGLLALGQLPGEKVVIFGETRAEWMISAQACFRNNIPVVTLYATLSVDAILHGIQETGVTRVITTMELLPKFEEVLKSTKLSHIIVMGGSPAQLAKVDLHSEVKVISMDDVEKLGKERFNNGDGTNNNVDRPKPDDIAVIMYTSGSTGLPKGVVISHRNLLCGTSGQSERIIGLGNRSDTYVAYLPLAHVLELGAEISCISKGTKMGYSSPNTLTDKSTKIKKGCLGDVSVLKPTLMAAVPVIMDRVYKNVWEKINSGGLVGKVLFGFAYDYKLKHIKNGWDTPVLNKIVFKKTKELLGGNIRLMLCGGAPLSGQTQYFMNVCFCCPVGQGYGLTETCGAGTVVEFGDISIDRCGPPLVCDKIVLKDWTEGGYKSSNKPHPQGEVLIGGGNVAMGYYKNPEKTAEDFITIDGMRYFRTGDIGQFDKDGCLRIIDRMKDLVKLQHGEYISLATVETVLKMCPLVEQICVVARSNHNSVVALAVMNQTLVENVAKQMDCAPGIGSFSQLCQNKKVEAAVLKQICAHGLKSKLSKGELPSAIRLYSEQWLPDSGLVTDAFKLKRKAIEEFFKADIDSMYQS